MTPLFSLAGGALHLRRTFYDVIHGVRTTSKGYIGTKKTIAEVGKLFECVPRSAIDMYVALCLVCHMWKPQTTRAPLKPIVSSGFMTRGQVNPCQ